MSFDPHDRTRTHQLYRRAWHVLGCSKGLACVMGAGALMHASGHAVMAAAGGILVRGLAGTVLPMDGRSSGVLAFLGARDPLLGLAILGLVAVITKVTGQMIAAWSESRIAGEVGADLRLELLDAIQRATELRPPRHADHGEAQGVSAPSATMVRLAALTSHVSDVEAGVAQGVFAEVRALVQLAPLAGLLIVFAPRLAVSALVALVLFSLLVTSTRRGLKRLLQRAASQNEALLTAADEAVRHADLWATYGAALKIRAHVEVLGRALVRSASRLRVRAVLLSGTSEGLGALALVLTLALVHARMIDVATGAVVPFSIVFFMAYKPLREFSEARLARARGETALAAAYAGLRESRPPSVPERPGRPRTRGWGRAGLELRGLVPQHGTQTPLSCVLSHGTIAALVGPTGVGKTSLLRVLLGLDAPRAGHIFWGREELTGEGVGPAARPFVWVPQDAPVLGATLAANLTLGLDFEGEQDAAFASRAMLVLNELAGAELAASCGESTLMTDRPMSGGERQWVAVARALATTSPVVLLDEPTSSLDPEAQRKMLDALARLRGERTIIIVTHRPEPLEIADVVLRLRPTPAVPGGASVATDVD